MVDFVGALGQLMPKVDMLMGLSRLSVCSTSAGSPTLSRSILTSIHSLMDMATIRLNDNGIGGKETNHGNYLIQLALTSKILKFVRH
jgi:hypothetical protein